MAVDAEGVVKLDDIKQNLRISHDDHDDLLVSLRASAIAHIETRTGLHLLDKIKSYRIPPPTRRSIDPLEFISVDLRAVDEITYHEPDQDISADPTGKVDDYIVHDALKMHTWLVYANKGWPSILEGTDFYFKCTVGQSEVPSDLVMALIVLVRDLYDGRKMEANQTVDHLMMPYQVFIPDKARHLLPKTV